MSIRRRWHRIVDRLMHWYERVIRRRDHYVSDEWRATWEEHEKEIAGGWKD